MTRRDFVALSAVVAASSELSCRTAQRRTDGWHPNRLFFTSQGRTGMINADGGGLRYFDFKILNLSTWQQGPFFSHVRLVIVLSTEARRDGPGLVFEA